MPVGTTISSGDVNLVHDRFRVEMLDGRLLRKLLDVEGGALPGKTNLPGTDFDAQAAYLTRCAGLDESENLASHELRFFRGRTARAASLRHLGIRSYFWTNPCWMQSRLLPFAPAPASVREHDLSMGVYES